MRTDGASVAEGAPDAGVTIDDLHRRFAGVLYDACVRILGDRSEAEDAVQETFVQAFRSLARFQGTYHLPWLYRIATNESLQILRTRRRKGLVLLEAVDQQDSGGPGMAEALQARRALEALLDELDPTDLEIVVAHFVHGMDQAAIAESLGISRRAVVKRLTRVRTRHRHVLGASWGDEEDPP